VESIVKDSCAAKGVVEEVVGERAMIEVVKW
jgi:hypothetical protein